MTRVAAGWRGPQSRHSQPPIASHLGKGRELINTEINLTVTLRVFGEFFGLPNGYRGTFCTGISYNLTVCYLNIK